MLPKLIKGRKYIITGAANENSEKVCNSYDIKFPQTVEFNGGFFIVKDMHGDKEKWFPLYFKYTRSATIEIYKSLGQFKFRVKSSNGKVLNHLFNSKQGCKKGIKALQEALKDYVIVDKTK